MRLKGKVALITGASTGIGRATAILFAKEGAKVVVVARTREKGEETVRIIKEAGGEAVFVKADVSKAADVEEAVKATIEKYGKLDIVYNNAGVYVEEGNVAEITEEDWNSTINTNLKGVFLTSKFAVAEMIKRGGGVIVNTSSICGLVGSLNSTAYCASKGGIITVTKAMAVDLAPYNIRVNCICPGAVLTPMLKKAFEQIASVPRHTYSPEQVRQAYIDRIPLRRIAEPEEIAYAALYLASDESSFVTGSVLVIDGGETATQYERYE